MNIYTAVVATNDLDRCKFTVGHILANSAHCREVVISWNGSATGYMGLIKFAGEMARKFTVPVMPVACYGREVYGMYNLGVSTATSEFVLLINDDMYVPPSWDFALGYLHEIPKVDPNDAVVTFQLVEPGYVDVNKVNIRRNFGETIAEFDKAAFDKFASEIEPSLECKQAYNAETNEISLGWYMPVIFPKGLFNSRGQYATFPPFPYPHDLALFENLKKDDTVIFVKLTSRVYHFQRLSQRYPELSHTRLNLACGKDKRIGWLNCDIKDSDMNFDLSTGILPFEANTFEEILFKHALEHFRLEIATQILLEIKRVLKPDGTVDIFVPDLVLACQDVVNDDFDPGTAPRDIAPPMNRLFGLNTSEEQVHKWGYSIRSLRGLLKDTLKFSRVENLPVNDRDEIGLRAWK